ncbi:MAG: sugar-binding protein [Thermoguttaceae bacterium]|jgi:hypothetical protein
MRLHGLLLGGLLLISACCGPASAADRDQTVLKLAEWCAISIPAGPWDVGRKVPIAIQYKGLPKTRLCCHLHGWRADGSMLPGALAVDLKPPEVSGDGRCTVLLPVGGKPDLRWATVYVFTSRNGEWEARDRDCAGPRIEITAASVAEFLRLNPQPPKGITYAKSWYCLDDAAAKRQIAEEGQTIRLPLDYYLDPGEDWGGTRLRIYAAGPWIDCPDGKYTKTRQHVGGLGQREVALRPGRGHEIVEFPIPPKLAERRTGVLFICSLVGAGDKTWPWETRYGGLWIKTKDPQFDLETQKPGNLFTYDEPLAIDLVVRGGLPPGQTRQVAWKVLAPDRKPVAEGATSFLAGRPGQRVPLPLGKIERRGILLAAVEVAGWGRREIALARIPDLAGIVKPGERNAFGMTIDGFYAPRINEQVFAVAQKLGLTNCRMFFNVRGYHPAPGDWRLEGWDGLLEAARRHGVSIWPCLCSPPVWLMDGKAADVGYEPFPFKRELWRDSIAELAAHWKGRVCGWEWLNEIVPGKLCDDPAAEYLEFCRIGSEEARRVDPQCESILAGGLWPRNFRNALLKGGAAQYVNVMPVHYANADQVADARGDLAAVRAEHVAVWDDESAAGMSVWGAPLAEMIAETVQSAWVLDRWPDELQAGCRRVIYFGGWPDAAGDWSYLLDDRQPRPVAVTLAVLTSKLHQARPLGTFYLGARGVFHLFQQGGKPVLLAASAQPGGEKIELAAGSDSLRLTDYQGNETTVATVAGKAAVQLGALGQFIEGARLDILLGYVMPKMVQPDGVAAARQTCQAVADQQSRTARLKFQVANLQGRALSGRILADAPAPLDAHGQAAFSVAPGGTAEVEVSLPTAAATPPGNYPLAVRVQYDDPALPAVPLRVNLCLTSQSMAGNLLVNGDFETGRFAPWQPGQGAVLQPAEGLGLGLGRQVLKIQATGDRWVHANQNLEHLPPGQAYLYSAWIWSRDMSAGSNVTLLDTAGKSKTLTIPSVFSTPEKMPGWALFSTVIRPPDNLARLSLTPVASGRGQALFDNLMLTVYDGSSFAAECRRAKTPHAIDGKTGGWQLRSPLPLLAENQLTKLSKSYRWTPENLSGAAYFEWDEQNLYLLVQVRDDKLVLGPTGEDCIRGDSLILAIDPDPGNRAAASDARAMAFYVSAAAPGGSGKHTLFRPARHSGGRPAGQLARDSSACDLCVTRQGTLTSYQLRLPISELGGFQPRPGLKIGLSLAINDCDGNGVEAVMCWGEGLLPSWNPRLFGSLTFVR